MQFFKLFTKASKELEEKVKEELKKEDVKNAKAILEKATDERRRN